MQKHPVGISVLDLPPDPASGTCEIWDEALKVMARRHGILRNNSRVCTGIGGNSKRSGIPSRFVHLPENQQQIGACAHLQPFEFVAINIDHHILDLYSGDTPIMPDTFRRLSSKIIKKHPRLTLIEDTIKDRQGNISTYLRFEALTATKLPTVKKNEKLEGAKLEACRQRLTSFQCFP